MSNESDDWEISQYSPIRFFYNDEFIHNFLPMSSKIESSWLQKHLRKTTSRARECLKERVDVQLVAMAELTDVFFWSFVRYWIRNKGLTDESVQDAVNQFVKSVVGLEAVVLRVMCDNLRRKIKKAKSGQYDLIDREEDGTDITRVNAVTPRDLYGVHALVQVARAINAASEEQATAFAMTALECVVMAELEGHDEKRRMDEFKARLSTANRSASEARWKKLEPVRQYAIEIYLSREWPSRVAAVRKMLPDILKKAEKVGAKLSEMNAVKTVDGWLKQAKK